MGDMNATNVCWRNDTDESISFYDLSCSLAPPITDIAWLCGYAFQPSRTSLRNQLLNEYIQELSKLKLSSKSLYDKNNDSKQYSLEIAKRDYSLMTSVFFLYYLVLLTDTIWPDNAKPIISKIFFNWIEQVVEHFDDTIDIISK